MSYTFGDLTDATNTARRETPLVVRDGAGNTYTVEDVQVEVSTEGAVTDILITIVPAPA